MFKIVILSRKPDNIVPCVQSIFRNDPNIPREDIVVVNDGCRNEHTEEQLPGITWIDGIQPFIFARNANLGITTSDTSGSNADIILLNDDTELSSPNGLTQLSRSEQKGITSAKIVGHGRVDIDRFVAFVCVFIPRVTINEVGLLDERFTLYGYEDNDYCTRVRAKSLPINACSECVIHHYHPDRSTFHGPQGLYKGDNLVAYDRKYGHIREYTWPEHLQQIAQIA